MVTHPDDPRRWLVGVSCGGAWETLNGGATWEVRSKGMFAEYMPPERREDPYLQDPHRIVRCAGQPDRLWAQHHNGVFASDDGGRAPPRLDGCGCMRRSRELRLGRRRRRRFRRVRLAQPLGVDVVRELRPRYPRYAFSRSAFQQRSSSA